MRNLFERWRSSLLLGTVVAVVGVVYLVGAMFMLSTWWFTQGVVHTQARANLTELLDTVETTARVAAFTSDVQLANEVVSGVLRNHAVAAAMLRGDSIALATQSRVPSSSLFENPDSHWLSRPLSSPFDPDLVVGEIVLIPDQAAIDLDASSLIRKVNATLSLLILVTAGAVVVIVLRLVVRPIKRFSDRLHEIDPVRGQRLRLPAGHEKNELGRLASDVNELLDKLVHVLDDERMLRRQREVDERKYRGIFENAETGIFVADLNGRVESFNPAFFILSDRDPASGEALESLYDLNWRASEAVRTFLAEAVDNDHADECDFEMLTRKGRSRWLNLSIRPVGEGYVQGIVSDITQRVVSESAARQLALTDTLTGLANRAGFERRLTAQIDCSPADVVAVILLDLIGFTRVNDGLGMSDGDKVLKTAAQRIASGVKHSDWLARLSGDDFVVVLPGISDATEAAAIAGRIVTALCVPYAVGDTPLYVGANAGVTLYPKDAADGPSLLRSAELALAEAEAMGEPSVVVFEPRMLEQIGQRRRLESDLRLALEREEFRLFYQPIVDLASGSVVGAEALIRWFHPERGMVPPDGFIPLAEQTGLVKPLGRWVLEDACRQLALWQKDGHSLYVSINVSALQIPSDLTASLLLSTLKRHGVSPGQLVLEITEGVLMADGEAGIAWLREVQAAGFRTYIDDFGTGYSSLSYLKRFPIDTVKIDKSFVLDMGSDSADYAMVKAILAMTAGLRLHVLAEGIETEEHLNLLRQLGCPYGQGYHFSRPVPAEDFWAVCARIESRRPGSGVQG